MKTGIQLIEEERTRQISKEGWTADHDDEHNMGELARAASLYCHPYTGQFKTAPTGWPWDAEWWKPSEDPVRNLVKAGALIAAEIDRLQRIKELPPMPGFNGDERGFR